MYVLVLEDGQSKLAGFGDMVRVAGHDVETVSKVEAATDLLGRRKADIAVVMASVEQVARVAKALRAPEDPTYRSLIVVLPPGSGGSEAAYEVGADDVVVSSLSAAELVDRIRAAERVVRLERKLRERVLELEGALRRLALHAMVHGKEVAASVPKPSRGGLGVLLTSTWTGLDEVIAGMCTDYLQMPFTQLVGAATPGIGVRGASIALNDVEDELKLELSFYASEESTRALATAFCGGDASMVDDDVIRDVLLELANSGMGALKAGFLGEEFRFAASIPQLVSGVDPAKQLEGAEAARVRAFRSESAVVYAVVTLKHQGRVRLPGARLKEGMVVASDVLNDAGLLLVRAGTRLTETTAEKLARMIPKREIELAAA